MTDGPEALTDIVPVSRETAERLAAYVALLRKWQRAENLIAPSTLPAIWRRHVADSAQLVALFPEARRWLDLGSGAGFPGLVVAILGAEHADTAVHLVESNRKKCAFLRQAIRETGAPAIVHEGRIEERARILVGAGRADQRAGAGAARRAAGAGGAADGAGASRRPFTRDKILCGKSPRLLNLGASIW